jgi:hypothetical protein
VSASTLDRQPTTSRSTAPSVPALLRAAECLTSAADPEAVLTSLVRVCTPWLADESLVSMIAPGGRQVWVHRASTRPHGDAPSPDRWLTGADIDWDQDLIGSRWLTTPLDDYRPLAEHCVTDNAIFTPIALSFEAGQPARPCGMLSLFFHESTPTAAHAVGAQLLVDRAQAVLMRDQLGFELEQARARIGNLEVALETSREIGIAVGIVMFQHKLSPEQGFDLLRRISQSAHRKVREVAADIATTGLIRLPAGVTLLPQQSAKPVPPPQRRGPKPPLR